MLRFLKFAPPTRRLLGLLALALVVLVILLTIATPSRAQNIHPDDQDFTAPAARTSSSQPAISSTPPSGVMGPSHRAPVRLKA